MKSLQEYITVNERKELVNKQVTKEEIEYIKFIEADLKKNFLNKSFSFVNKSFINNGSIKEFETFLTDHEYKHFIGLTGVLLEYNINKYITENKSKFINNNLLDFYNDYENIDVKLDNINFEVKTTSQGIDDSEHNNKNIISFKKSINITKRQANDIKLSPFIIIIYDIKGFKIIPCKLYVRFPWQVYIGRRNEEGKKTFHITGIDKIDEETE